MFAFDNKGQRQWDTKDHPQRNYAGRRSTHALRAEFRKAHGPDWASNKRTKAQYDARRFPWKAAAAKMESKYGPDWGDQDELGRATAKKRWAEYNRLKGGKARKKASTSRKRQPSAAGRVGSWGAKRGETWPKYMSRMSKKGYSKGEIQSGWHASKAQNNPGQPAKHRRMVVKRRAAAHARQNPVGRGSIRHARRVASYR
jgi:hypothetical protein